MDELDLLKKDWKKQDASYPELSYNEIYKLIHKKSSSIVKWIFIICIVELLFWSGLNLLVPEKYLEIYDKFNLRTFLYVTQVIHYSIVFIFIYLFYKNYKAISVTETTNLLMQKIIKTRKTVNYYVYYNIALYVLLSVIVNFIMFSNPETMIEALNPNNKINVSGAKFLNIMLIAQIIALVVIIGLLWIYYRIIYGILLKRLNRNYKELETLEF
ncbi:hypothetical protein BX611_1992 [Lutibacter oceani]|uniref:Uncharacterized protein n=1 Tax=Lutibacter oceani TaxID=1853311 RepID=A0A3D9RKE3_9FLAO|nr:hypothetical protein [Lutibacter oceani]REE80350.1 hypothetical protein BX611_1992 [Lutibacter oceani]